MKNLAEDQKQKLIEDLHKKEEEEEKAKTKQQKLLKKLKGMEEKLLVGSKVMEEAIKQEKVLKKTKTKLEKENKKAVEMEMKLQEKVEDYLQAEEKFKSMQDELDYKTKKLEKLWNKFQGAQGELQ